MPGVRILGTLGTKKGVKRSRCPDFWDTGNTRRLLSEWGHINGYLTDTILTAQDKYKALLDYFKVKY